MTPFLGEIIGAAMLILLGNGVVANVVLSGTKGNNSGWIVITFGWAMAVFVAVSMVGVFSGAHLNPSVTVGLAIAGKFEWALVPSYIVAQFLGAFLGAALVWLVYRPHFAVTEDRDAKLAVFCTGPAIRDIAANLASEIVGTFVLVITVLFLAVSTFGLGALDALPVGLLVLGIGLSLGGTTGYAINPARDLGPRIMHAILPIPGGQTRQRLGLCLDTCRRAVGRWNHRRSSLSGAAGSKQRQLPIVCGRERHRTHGKTRPK